MNPNITVFTPTYNRANTLNRVYESLVSQTYKDFEWLVIDDGSTDNTEEIINLFKKENKLNIRYIKQENTHKFITIFNAVDLAKGEYFIILDSDDRILSNSLEKLENYWKKVPENIVYVLGLCVDEKNNIVGDKFTKSPLITTIFDLRYKYKIKGDKWGMTKTDIYKQIKETINLDKLKNKGFIPEGVYQYQFDLLGKHYCINEPVRIYIRDEGDKNSLANNFYDDKNSFGLAETYKNFTNIYYHKIFTHTKIIIKNYIAYLIYSAKDKRTFKQVFKEINPIWAKLLSLIYPIFRSKLKKY